MSTLFLKKNYFFLKKLGKWCEMGGCVVKYGVSREVCDRYGEGCACSVKFGGLWE